MTVQSYTIKAVQGVTGLGRSSIYAAIANGSLRARKMGTRTLIMSNDLEDWLNSLPALKPSKANHG